MFVVKNLKSENNIYWIKKIESNFVGKNDFIDIQYCKVYLQQNYYKLKFNLIFYIANNFFLPANSITAKVVAPTFEVDNISLIKTKENIDTSIENIQSDAISVYRANFDVDITDDLFFQGTSNKSFHLNITFNFDSELLNSNNSSIDPNIFETFLNELLNTHFLIEMQNTSYLEINEKTIYSHKYAFENDSLNRMLDYYKKIKFEKQNFSSVDYSIKKLFSFEILDEIDKLTISNVNLKLHYKYEEVDKVAQLTFNSELDYSSSNLSFILNSHETFFDKSKNEIIFQTGNKGIFFPFDTSGFYEINFNLMINNKPIIYSLKNEYSYIFQTNKANFIVENFSEELIDYEEIFYQE